MSRILSSKLQATMPAARKRIILLALAALLLAGAAWWVYPKLLRRFYHHGLSLLTVAQGLETPWAFVFLPGRRFLVTERVGRMRIVEGARREASRMAGSTVVATSTPAAKHPGKP